ncbi:5-formyltetrahydrofolate cyclo-ligase [Glaciimonas sp. PAMC28666]|uniref:5-formyltetrahydrofolate cyclo-ligase n=1 Tax=Glaciimonas sp. PAMC28666 TaxID=2807626 RepID=UPI0019664630|nr:5-formyltetrahydrofolate cyclo-ligase [Glaciimonas sp. PAMC28666]QRX83956.1 5-formyltetrahydrofolate cyclo-ligase [Glaciimonas sp. PAMC28666]
MTSPSIACDTPDSGPENGPDKALLRIALLTARKRIPDDQRRAFDTAIGAQVLDWATSMSGGNAGGKSDFPDVLGVPGVLGVYWPIRGEPDLHATYAALIARGVRLALPVVIGAEEPLQFVRWTPGEAMIKDSFGVPFPASGDIVSPQALLIPCVGFTRARLRLGYGGGFYDRTLAVNPRPTTIGISYAEALVEFDSGMHDIALDQIFTESGCF